MSKIINGVASEYEMPTSRCKTLEDLVNNYETHIKYHDYEFDELSYKLLILDIKKILQENKQLKSKLEMYENGVYYSSENDKLKEVIEEVREYNNQIIKDTKDFYRPTKDVIYSGDTLIDLAETNIQILDKVKDVK